MPPLVCLLILCAAETLPVAAAAQTDDCVEYDSYLHWTGAATLPGLVLDVAVAGEFAIAAAGDSGLQMIDIADASAMTIIARLDLPGSACTMTADASHAILVGEQTILHVIDLAEPSAPDPVASQVLPGPAIDVAVAGHHAHVLCAGDAGGSLQIVDLEQPTSPALAGGLTVADWSPRALAVRDGHVYGVGVRAGSSTLTIIDVSDPHAPVIAGEVELTSEPTDVAVSGAVACVVNAGFGLELVDVAVPAMPWIAGRASIGAATRIAVAGDRACAVGDAITIIDLSAPASPAVVAEVPLDFATCAGLAGERVVVGRGGCAGASCWGGLSIFDWTVPEPPPLLDTLPLPGSVQDVTVHGDHAYVAVIPDGVYVLDWSVPGSPVVIGFLDTPGNAHETAAAGDLAYVASAIGGILVVDIAEPTAPAIIGVFEISGATHDVAVDDRFVYAVSSWRTDTLWIIDCSEPTAPELVGSIETPACTHDLVVQGNHAFVSECNGLQVIDISTPSSPTFAGSARTRSTAGGMAIRGDRAYVSVGGTTWSGLEIFDIAEPASPVAAGHIVTPRFATDVTLTGDLAYVSHYLAPLQIIDVTNASAPRPVGTIPRVAYAAGVAGDRVLLAAGLDGCLVYPAQCALPNRVELITLEVAATPGAVTITWETADEQGSLGFHIRRRRAREQRSERITPALIPATGAGGSRYHFSDRAVLAGETLLYVLEVVDLAGTVQTFQSSPVTIPSPRLAGPRLDQNRPNPFNPSTRLTFELPQPARATLGIYDVAGRRVRTLIDDTLEAGIHHLDWDGRDDRGRPLASAIYLYRLQIGEQSLTRRLAILR